MKLRKKLDGIVKSDEKNIQVSNLIDRYDKEALINSLSNSSASLLDSTFKSLVATFTVNFVAKSEDKNIKQLTEMMQSLALSICTIVTFKQVISGYHTINVSSPTKSVS